MNMRPFRFALLVSTVCLLWCVPAAGADVSVGSASAFSNSVGVDTHLTFANTAYGDWPRLVAALNDLGVAHVSDSAYGNPSWGWFNSYFQNAVELAASHGIRFAFEMGKPGYQGGTIGQLVSVLSGPLRNAVEAVEAPNEFDSSGVPDWASQLAAYDRQLYAAVKASPSLRSLPVIGPSLVGDGAPAELGAQQSWLDVGNIHPYTGGLSPSPSYTAAQLQRISVVSAHKPVWATEMGYYNALNAPQGTLQPVSEAVSAVYLLREFLEDFKSGIARTYAYELIDDNPDPANSDIQLHVDEAVRGRVLSIYMVAFGAAFPIGSLVAGIHARELSRGWFHHCACDFASWTMASFASSAVQPVSWSPRRAPARSSSRRTKSPLSSSSSLK